MLSFLWNIVNMQLFRIEMKHLLQLFRHKIEDEMQLFG